LNHPSEANQRNCFFGAAELDLSMKRRSLYFFHMWKPWKSPKIKATSSFRLRISGGIDNQYAMNEHEQMTEGGRFPPNRALSNNYTTDLPMGWLARLYSCLLLSERNLKMIYTRIFHLENNFFFPLAKKIVSRTRITNSSMKDLNPLIFHNSFLRIFQLSWMSMGVCVFSL